MLHRIIKSICYNLLWMNMEDYNFLDNSTEGVAKWNVQVIKENIQLTFSLINYFSSTFDFEDTSTMAWISKITENS